MVRFLGQTRFTGCCCPIPVCMYAAFMSVFCVLLVNVCVLHVVWALEHGLRNSPGTEGRSAGLFLKLVPK